MPVPAAEAVANLRAFVDLLQREQALLAAGDVNALPPLIAEKTALAERLERLPQEQTGELRELAAQARALNETNGKLIGLHLQHTQQALSVLLAAANQAATYGPDGQQQGGLGSRSLGKA